LLSAQRLGTQLPAFYGDGDEFEEEECTAFSKSLKGLGDDYDEIL